MSSTFCVRRYGPAEKPVLFWNGMLIMLEMGFCAAAASTSLRGLACAAGLGDAEGGGGEAGFFGTRLGAGPG